MARTKQTASIPEGIPEGNLPNKTLNDEAARQSAPHTGGVLKPATLMSTTTSITVQWVDQSNKKGEGRRMIISVRPRKAPRMKSSAAELVRQLNTVFHGTNEDKTGVAVDNKMRLRMRTDMLAYYTKQALEKQCMGIAPLNCSINENDKRLIETIRGNIRKTDEDLSQYNILDGMNDDKIDQRIKTQLRQQKKLKRKISLRAKNFIDIYQDTPPKAPRIPKTPRISKKIDKERENKILMGLSKNTKLDEQDEEYMEPLRNKLFRRMVKVLARKYMKEKNKEDQSIDNFKKEVKGAFKTRVDEDKMSSTYFGEKEIAKLIENNEDYIENEFSTASELSKPYLRLFNEDYTNNKLTTLSEPKPTKRPSQNKVPQIKRTKKLTKPTPTALQQPRQIAKNIQDIFVDHNVNDIISTPRPLRKEEIPYRDALGYDNENLSSGQKKLIDHFVINFPNVLNVLVSPT